MCIVPLFWQFTTRESDTIPTREIAMCASPGRIPQPGSDGKFITALKGWGNVHCAPFLAIHNPRVRYHSNPRNRDVCIAGAYTPTGKRRQIYYRVKGLGQCALCPFSGNSQPASPIPFQPEKSRCVHRRGVYPNREATANLLPR